MESDGAALYATPQARFNEQSATLGATSKAVAGHLQALFDGCASPFDVTPTRQTSVRRKLLLLQGRDSSPRWRLFQ